MLLRSVMAFVGESVQHSRTADARELARIKTERQSIIASALKYFAFKQDNYQSVLVLLIQLVYFRDRSPAPG